MSCFASICDKPLHCSVRRLGLHRLACLGFAASYFAQIVRLVVFLGSGSVNFNVAIRLLLYPGFGTDFCSQTLTLSCVAALVWDQPRGLNLAALLLWFYHMIVLVLISLLSTLSPASASP